MNLLKHNNLLFTFFYLPLISSFSVFYLQGDWVLQKKASNISLWTKDVPGKKYNQFKIQCEASIKLEATYRLLKDIEKSNLWYDNVKNIKVLEKISEQEAIYLMEYDLPFPFEDRISTIKGTIAMDEKKGTVKATTSYYPYTIPENKKHLLLVKEMAGSWEISQLQNHKLLITHTGYMDPGGSVPSWLVNQGITVGPFNTINGFLRMAEKY